MGGPVGVDERLARLRRQQLEGRPPMIEEVSAAFAAQLTAHEDHPWTQVGRCVYCGPCGVKLYQGAVPDGHPAYVPPAKPRDDMLTRFRERWGIEEP